MVKEAHIAHSPIDNLTFSFDVPGKSLIALYNAIGFTIAHRNEYINESGDCPNCFEAMRAINSYLWNLINTGDKVEPLEPRFN